VPDERRYRAGQSIEDACRACKTDRTHTIIVVDAGGVPLRVTCDYCGSEHNFRGGGRIATVGTPTASGPTLGAAPARTVAPARTAAPPRPARGAREPFPIVSDRERTSAAVSSTSDDLEILLRRIIREEAGVSPTVPADKWRGGTLVLRPGSEGQQEKSWPIETFFHKVVMMRNRLRTLEQQVNASDLPDDTKVKLQSYISGCYGSLTSFNVLFADEADQFTGSGGD
jgi:hypothetical protein